QPQLREHLFSVNLGERLHGFQLNDDFAFNQKIGAKSFVEDNFVVTDRNGNLTLNLKSLFSQFMSEGDFINAFEQARASSCVHSESGIENQFGKLIFVESGFCVFHRGNKMTPEKKLFKQSLTRRPQRSQRKPSFLKPLRPSRPLREA